MPRAVILVHTNRWEDSRDDEFNTSSTRRPPLGFDTAISRRHRQPATGLAASYPDRTYTGQATTNLTNQPSTTHMTYTT